MPLNDDRKVLIGRQAVAYRPNQWKPQGVLYTGSMDVGHTLPTRAQMEKARWALVPKWLQKMLKPTDPFAHLDIDQNEVNRRLGISNAEVVIPKAEESRRLFEVNTIDRDIEYRPNVLPGTNTVELFKPRDI